ncbi:MAG: CvpA family protein [Pseudomonadota bacterium]
MTLLDWIFIAIIGASMVVGAFRGIIKEAVSLSSLLIATWAAFHFAPLGENLLGEWIGSAALRTWAARIAIFALVLMLGGLAGWLIARFANQVGLTSMDRMFGLGFGFLRGAVISGLVVIVGPYMALDKDDWWRQSTLLPYAQAVADGIGVLAPKAFDYLREEIITSPPRSDLSQDESSEPGASSDADPQRSDDGNPGN